MREQVGTRINMRQLRRELRARSEYAKTRGVYALVDPRTCAVRYIGLSEHIERRFFEHVCHSNRERTLGKHAWVMGLIGTGKIPELRILEVVNDCDIAPIEREWIKAYELVGEADMNWCETTRTGKKTKHK